MKKRLSSLILCIAMLVSVFAAPVSAEGGYDENKWNLLMTFDILYTENIEESADDVLTRGDYVTYLIYLMNKGEMTYEGVSQFSDLEEYDNCFAAANLAKQLGYLKDSTFRADDDISYAEARDMLVRAMGYADAASSVMPSLPYYNDNHIMTLNDMVELFYAAMHEPLLKYDISVGETIKLEIDDDKTILSEYYDVEIIEGIVTENSRTTLYSGDKYTNRYMGINDKNYGDSRNFGEDWLGLYVRAYIDFSDDKDYGNVVYVAEKPNKNTVITISGEDIEEVNSNVSKITYLKEDSAKSISKKIDENVNVIYNGKAYTKYTAADLMPENGNVTIIDNDNDGIFEVVKVWSYETVFVDRVSAANKIIYNKHDYAGALTDFSLDTYSGNFEYEIFENDSKKDFSRLKSNQILSIARSKNDTNAYIRIYISGLEETGVFEAIDREDNTITISGNEYKTTPEFVKQYTNLSLLASYKIYFDCFGRAAGATEIRSNETEYVYLYSAVYDDAETAVFLKVFTPANEWVKYRIDEKIRFNGKKVEPERLTKYVEDYGRMQLVNEVGDTVRQVLKIKVLDDKLTDINTAKVNGSYEDFSTSGKRVLRYYGQNSSFGHEYFLSSKSVVFGIPSDDPSNLEAYRTITSPSWDKDYTIEAYGYDEYNGADVIVLEVPVSTFKKSINDCLILGVSKMINSDDSVVGCVKTSFGLFEDLSIETVEGYDFSTLKKGDIVTLNINEEGKAESFTRNAGRSYSWIDDGKKLYRPDNLHIDGYQMGKVVKTDPDNERMMVVFDNTGKKVTVKLDFVDLVVKRYNTKKNICQVISTYNIEPGDYFVMYSGGSYAYTIIIFDDDM